MSLALYQRKRQFKSTPEPKGKKQTTTGPLTFVVQKHQASGLHYDFRLELNGVLISWAVPKGPSLDPEEKRLAMHVEDHPLDYAGFEGIIPKDNYGAGTVMVWDSGVYAVVDRASSANIPYEAKDRQGVEKILTEQLASGHLTFVMLGQKLKGEFALVKIKNSEDDAWLLLKKGDEYASKEDILQDDHSTLTNRSMKEIAEQAEKKDEVWISRPKDLDLGGAPKEAFPDSIEPMLAGTAEEPFNHSDWLYELKWDGYRGVAMVQTGNVTLYSRNHQNYSTKFAPVAEALTKFPGSAVLDGEVVVVDSSGKPNFGWLQDYPKSDRGELIYYVFDILHFDGYNLRNLPLIKRKEILRQVLPPLPHVSFSHHIEERGLEFFKQTSELNLEGIIAKKADSVYQPGTRSQNWLKIKSLKSQEAVIAGFTKGNGGRVFGALVLGLYEQGKLRYIGHTGGGFNEKSLKLTFEKLEPLVQSDCPFEAIPKTNAPVTWVKPVLLCEVSFREWTKEGHMRQPIFIRLREDKEAQEALDERIFSREAPEKEESKKLKVGQKEIKFVNPGKVFWPKEKITKFDLLNYYREIVPILLPHLKDRPQSLKRYPHGITGESFFQKDTNNLNETWLKKVKISSESEARDVEYMLCQDEASLIYMVNLGCIDLNPWSSRTANLENPDYLIIDLDPEDISFSNVVKVALEIRKLLEELDIISFPKTSGARGLHIYIPMGAKYTYEQTRHLAEFLCLQIQNRIPRISSMVRNPKERQGKVYLDYLQNARGQTLASVYSVRPQSGAPVSTPLLWEEVTEKLHPSQFTISNLPKRLDKHDDLFKGTLGKGIDLKKVLEAAASLLRT